jgi:hypothetical protein
MPFLGAVSGSAGYGRMIKPAAAGGAAVTGLQKTVGGTTYTLIVAHRAFNYPSTPFPGPSDTFFQSMFNTGYNTQFTQLSDIWTLTDTNNYVNSSLFLNSCSGYLLEAYNYGGTQFPVWGTFDTTAHTWQSLRTRGQGYGAPTTGITVSNSKLYASTDTSVSKTVGFTSFLTTSFNGTGATDWSTDTGDTIFMGISTAGFVAGDSYDTTFNQPGGGSQTSIGIAMSDGSGTNITMATYTRRAGAYKHCTAISNGTAITSGRSSTSHGGADSTGFFLVWGKF